MQERIGYGKVAPGAVAEVACVTGWRDIGSGPTGMRALSGENS